MNSHKLQTTQGGQSGSEYFFTSRDPIQRLKQDLCNLGFEYDIKIVMLAYLGCTARRFNAGQQMLVTGQTSTGKSYLVKKICDCIPFEDQMSYEYASPRALLNRAPTDGTPLDLSQIVLVGDERTTGLADPQYLRTLFSSGEVSVPIATGARTAVHRLVGRPALLQTTTESGISDEDQNRRLILPVNESQEKTTSIVGLQNRIAAGTLEHDLDSITGIHQKIQKELPKPSSVIVPFAQAIIPGAAPFGAVTRAHSQLLAILRAVALLRYRKRKFHDGKLVCKVKDYSVARELLAPLHDRQLAQIAGQEIDLIRSVASAIESIPRLSPKRNRFTRRDIRDWANIPRSTDERRIQRCVGAGLLIVEINGGKGKKHEYSLSDEWESSLARGSMFPVTNELLNNMEQMSIEHK